MGRNERSEQEEKVQERGRLRLQGVVGDLRDKYNVSQRAIVRKMFPGLDGYEFENRATNFNKVKNGTKGKTGKPMALTSDYARLICDAVNQILCEKKLGAYYQNARPQSFYIRWEWLSGLEADDRMKTYQDQLDSETEQIRKLYEEASAKWQDALDDSPLLFVQHALATVGIKAVSEPMYDSDPDDLEGHYLLKGNDGDILGRLSYSEMDRLCKELEEYAVILSESISPGVRLYIKERHRLDAE